LLGRNRAARACIDLSDGLADGIRQMGEASGLGAVIDAHALPIEPKRVGLHDALSGGEDYELLFSVSPKLRRRLNGVRRLVTDLPVTRIGRLTADRALVLDVNGKMEPLPTGFVHFE
jgi:thiamine-monophosphate kinase